MNSLRSISALLLVAIAHVGPAHAQEYPDKPIRLIVGYVPGGSGDISARLLAESLSAQLPKAVVVENKPGATSAIALEYVAKSKPDGYTLAWATSESISILPALKSNLPFAVPKDFTFIAGILTLPLAVAVRPNLPINSMAELIAYAKDHPGELRYGSSGIGSSAHVATLLLEKQAGIKLVHVPYKGAGAAINDLIAGHIDLSLPSLNSIVTYGEAGKVKLLAVTGENRDPLVPNLPTMKEVGLPGATVVVWWALLGPAGLPPQIVDRLQKDLVAGLGTTESKQRFKTAGFVTDLIPGDVFEKSVVRELKQWKDLAAKERIVLDE